MAAIPLTQGGPTDSQNCEFHWHGEYVEAHLLSDVGKKREHNEDSCIMSAPDNAALMDDRGMVFAIADGMGGASAGECASHLALQTLVEEYYAGTPGTVPTRLREAVEAANLRVFEESEAVPEYRGMGTTMSSVIIHGDHAYVAQVGDSRVYAVRQKAGLLQITHDHSLVAEQVRNGYISEEEARTHSLKNLITRAVGIKETVKIDLFAFNLKLGDTLLICSDGLSNLVKDEEIAKILLMDSIQGAARVLVGRALEEGGVDNITTAVIRVVAPPPKREVDIGAQEVAMPKTGLLEKIKSALNKPIA